MSSRPESDCVAGVLLRQMPKAADGGGGDGADVGISDGERLQRYESCFYKLSTLQQADLDEGKLSGDICRASEIDVEYQDERGRGKRKKLRGFEARVFQHEFDHINGVLHIDRQSPSDRTRIQSYLDVLIAEHGPGGVLTPDPVVLASLPPVVGAEPERPKAAATATPAPAQKAAAAPANSNGFGGGGAAKTKAKPKKKKKR